MSHMLTRTHMQSPWASLGDWSEGNHNPKRKLRPAEKTDGEADAPQPRENKFVILVPGAKTWSGPSPKPLEERFWPKVIKTEGCWRWSASRHKYGYGKIGTYKGGWICAHVASWVIHFGQVPPGMIVCHKCDNPECTRPDHLFLGEPRHNTQDAKNKGRLWAELPRAKRKFSPSQIREIRKLHMGGMSITKIALETLVSEPCISGIVKWKTYKNVV